MLLELFKFVISLIALLYSADQLVEVVIVLAKRFGVSTLVIGLTVVAIGTSLPEVMVSADAALHGHPAIALGNVIGSNICNVGLILGIPALIAPIVVRPRVMATQGGLMLAISFGLWALAVSLGVLEPFIGVLFLVFFTSFLFVTFRREAAYVASVKAGKKGAVDASSPIHTGVESEDAGFIEEVIEEVVEEVEEKKIPKRMLKVFIKTIALFAILLISSDVLVQATVTLAGQLGVSEHVIAISLVAFGTSVPELSVSLAAIRRGESEILIGNILGSNISNILLVLGVAATITPVVMKPITIKLDLPVMVFFSLLMVIFLSQKDGITKPKGIVLLALYGLVIVRCVVLPV